GGRTAELGNRSAISGSPSDFLARSRRRENRTAMRFFCIVVCLLSLAPGVLAQDAPSRLTLEDAIRLARGHTPEFRQVLNDVDVAVASERAAWGALFPSVSASLSFGGSHSRALTRSGDFGEVIVNPTYVETTSSTASQGVGLSMTLF